MKGLITAVAFELLFACQTFAGEHSTLARITVYWHGEGSASMHLGTAHNCATGIVLSIPRKFPMAAELSFVMRHALP
jgi:hypothetical protein